MSLSTRGLSSRGNQKTASRPQPILIENKPIRSDESGFPDNAPPVDLEILCEILNRPWFPRVRIFKKHYLRVVPSLFAENERISKLALYIAINHIISAVQIIMSEEIDFRDMVPVRNLAQGAQLIPYRTIGFVVHPSRLPLDILLQMAKPREGQVCYEATDPRDQVFALLNIA